MMGLIGEPFTESFVGAFWAPNRQELEAIDCDEIMSDKAGRKLGLLVDFARDLYQSERRCRVCKCAENSPCLDEEHGPCWWVEEDLCSHCAMGLDCDHAGATEQQLRREMNG